MLAEPLSPAPDKTISLIVLNINLVTKLFSIPHQHIVVDLHSLCIQHYIADPIWQPARSEHLMEQPLMKFALRLYILEEHHLEKVGLKKDIHKTRAHLHNCQVKKESWAD